MGRQDRTDIDAGVGRIAKDGIELRPMLTKRERVLRSFLLLHERFVGYYDPPTGTVHYLEDVADSDQLRIHRVLQMHDHRKQRKVSRPPPLLPDEIDANTANNTTSKIWCPEDYK